MYVIGGQLDSAENEMRHLPMRHKPDAANPLGLLSVAAAAEFLGGVAESTIRNWLSQGKLTRVKIGSRTMIREAELLNMIRPAPSTAGKGRS